MSDSETVSPAREHQRKERLGSVVSAKQQKTIVVQVDRSYSHPVYKKVMKSKKKYYAHDEQNEAHVGDVVRITETRPLSKLKRWRLVEVVRKAKLDD
jgi:small subunit ribosomal protein S17